MARFYKILALGLIVLIVAQDAFAYKAKKEKKNKEVKSKGKHEQAFVEEGNGRQGKHNRNHQRILRSVKNGKTKLLEEPREEKVQFKIKKLSKPQIDDTPISRRYEDSCGKKYECGTEEKRRQKVLHLAIGDKGKEKSLRNGKAKYLYLTTEGANSEANFAQEYTEPRTRSRKAVRERKIPGYLVLGDSAVDFLSEGYTIRTVRNSIPKTIIESEAETESESEPEPESEADLENLIEVSDSHLDLNETEDEFEEDFL